MLKYRFEYHPDYSPMQYVMRSRKTFLKEASSAIQHSLGASKFHGAYHSFSHSIEDQISKAAETALNEPVLLVWDPRKCEMNVFCEDDACDKDKVQKLYYLLVRNEEWLENQDSFYPPVKFFAMMPVSMWQRLYKNDFNSTNNWNWYGIEQLDWKQYRKIGIRYCDFDIDDPDNQFTKHKTA